MNGRDFILTGGCAFPCQERDGQGNPTMGMEFGMTLRDWFAGMAMQGMLGGMGFDAPLSHKASPAPVYAETAYEFADAMIAAREAKP